MFGLNTTFKGGLLKLAFLLLCVGLTACGPDDEQQQTQPPQNQVTYDERYPPGFLVILDDKGHAIEKHIGQSDDFLRERLAKESIKAASTFNDMNEAENAIRTILLEREQLVQAWIKTDKSSRKAFYVKMDEPVGRVLERGWAWPRSGNQARVVLVRDLTSDYKFAILTAYPEYKE